MAKPQRFCIFCGSPGLSREHVFADWLRNYVPRDLERHTQKHSIVGPRMEVWAESTRKFSGDPRSRRVPVVCRPCNQGWMGKMQERAKPYLLPLILGQSSKLRPTGQSAVAAWATMAVMVAEHVDPRVVTVPPPERTKFMNTLQPPKTWHIWLARYVRSEWNGYWAHNSIHFIPPEQNPTGRPQRAPARKNSQETTFVVGQLYIRAFSSPFSLHESWMIPAVSEGQLVRLWAPERHTIRWPPPLSLSDQQAFGLSNYTIDRVAHGDA
jgi:hypothetical protein